MKEVSICDPKRLGDILLWDAKKHFILMYFLVFWFFGFLVFGFFVFLVCFWYQGAYPDAQSACSLAAQPHRCHVVRGLIQ